MTKEEAIALHDSGFWEDLTYYERAKFQLFEDRLCMPFSVFHEAITKALGRDVWTHEFAYRNLLQKEFLGELPPPTQAEIFALIPEKKRILVKI